MWATGWVSNGAGAAQCSEPYPLELYVSPSQVMSNMNCTHAKYRKARQSCF